MSGDSDNPNTSRIEPKDGWNPELNQDEAIMAQQREIEKEIADKLPLIGPKVSLDVLLNEYSNSDGGFLDKIKQSIRNNYEGMRKVRPDGNCFFRGFAFAYFESLLNDPNEIKRILEVLEQGYQMLLKRLDKSAIEDFHEMFVDVIRKIDSKETTTVDQLLELFNSSYVSDYIIAYLRILTSGYLRNDQEFYQNFVCDSTLIEFCEREVEPLNKECDHIHITGITNGTGIPVCINYLDRRDGADVHQPIFPADSKPRIHLLYRPGHYDVLYPKQQANASSE